MSKMGEKLRSHANNTLLKFLQAFRKTNVVNITKTSSLINNLISFSRDQFNQNKGLDMLEHEKTDLRNHFDERQHHIIVSLNIFLYLFRWHLLGNLKTSRGKTFEWKEERINNMIDNIANRYVQ